MRSRCTIATVHPQASPPSCAVLVSFLFEADAWSVVRTDLSGEWSFLDTSLFTLGLSRMTLL